MTIAIDQLRDLLLLLDVDRNEHLSHGNRPSPDSFVLVAGECLDSLQPEVDLSLFERDGGLCESPHGSAKGFPGE